jgi:Ser/Thr protein kinase RdoA (MazF antagonist)
MKLTKNQINAIEKIFTTLELGGVTNIKYVVSSQNIVYKIETEKKSYILKEYSEAAIKNAYDLQKRKMQVSVSEKFSQNGIPAILPIKFVGKNFIHYKKKYYLLYDNVEYTTISEKELTPKKLKKMANTLAIMHNLNLKSDLPCQYKTIKIDYNKYLAKYKRIDEKLYKTLYDNFFVLENLTNNCNNNIRYVKNNLCVSHNDYKLDNILWDKDFMYLIDFDACAMSNPSVCLAESAFSLSKQGNTINLDYYKEFVKTYTKKFGFLSNNYHDALAVAVNGKLQYLEYLMSLCSKKNQIAIKETIGMIKELVLYNKNIEEFYNIYMSCVKK